MSEQPPKYRITAFVDPANESLLLEIEGLDGKISREVMYMKDRVVRQGLIGLGWTPPGLADRLAEALSIATNYPVTGNWYKTAEKALAAYEKHKKQNTP